MNQLDQMIVQAAMLHMTLLYEWYEVQRAWARWVVNQ